MIALAFSFCFPVLLLTAGLQKAVLRFVGADAKRRVNCAILASSFLLTLIPISGVPIGRWLIGVNANFSITLSALLLSAVVAGFGGRRILDRDGRFGLYVFAATAGLLLYPMALGLGGWDPYFGGWDFSWLHVLMCAVTVALIWRGNVVGLVLLAAAVAWALGLLESTNLWDYIVDPFLFITAAIGVAHHFITRYARARSPAPQESN